MKTLETLNQILDRKEEYLNHLELLDTFTVLNGEFYALVTGSSNVGCYITKKSFDNNFIENADGVSYTLEKCISRDIAVAIKENILRECEEGYIPHEFSIVKFSKVLFVNTVEEYFKLKAISGVEPDSMGLFDISTLPFDSVIITSSVVRSLNRIKDKYTLRFNGNGSYAVFNPKVFANYPIDIDDKVLLKYKSEFEDNFKERVKRSQFIIKKFNFCDFDHKSLQEGLNPIIKAKNFTEVAMSENRVFRRFHTTKDNINYADLFCVVGVDADAKAFDTEYQSGTEYMARVIESLIRKGFELEINGGKHLFKVLTQSAAQARTAKYYFFDTSNREGVTISDIRKFLAYGNSFANSEGKVNIAKREGRLALAFSNTVRVLKNYKVPRALILDDPSYTIKNVKAVVPYDYYEDTTDTVGVFDDNEFARNMNSISRVEYTRKDITYTPHDGQGMIELDYACVIAKDLGIISNKECRTFSAFYTTEGFEGLNRLHKLEGLDKLSKKESYILRIFKKMPKALQIRNAGDKGLLLVFPFRHYRPDWKGYNIVAGDNFRKYSLSDYSGVTFEIAGVPAIHSKYSDFNYQFLTALNISAEEMIEIADDTILELSEGIMKDPRKALEFIGDYSIGDEEDIQLNSKLDRIITTNSSFLEDAYIQKQLSNKIAKKLERSAVGKFKVKGAYHYCVTDPFAFMRDTMTEDDKAKMPEVYEKLDSLVMTEEENYLDGKDMYLGLFRSPMYSKYQICHEKFVNKEELWFLDNICVLTSKKLTLMALSGASL